VPNEHSVSSGDDMFLMIQAKKVGIVAYSANIETAAWTDLPAGFGSFISQRVRWAGKTKKMNDKSILLFGSLLTLLFHKDDYSYRAIGASGAVTGILYSAILLQPDMSLYLFFIPIPIPAYLFGMGYLLYSIYGMKAKNDNIGHTAHFGGAIGGYLLTIIKEPQMITENTFMVVLLAIPIVILFVLAKAGKL
jgi:cellulose synthase/poly-beta-1,6-N-acetylglucosamine synthase-like glycosyltransferase